MNTSRWKQPGKRTVRFRHSETESGIPLQHVRKESSLLLLVAEVDNWWSANRVTTSQCPDDTQVAAPGYFINDDEVVESVPVLWIDVPGKPLAIEVVCSKWEGADGCISELCVSSVNLSGKGF